MADKHPSSTSGRGYGRRPRGRQRVAGARGYKDKKADRLVTRTDPGVVSLFAERAAVIVTTNLPFSEWTTKFPNARLCKAMLDRLTDQANIIETGDESYRFRRTLAKKGGKA